MCPIKFLRQFTRFILTIITQWQFLKTKLQYIIPFVNPSVTSVSTVMPYIIPMSLLVLTWGLQFCLYHLGFAVILVVCLSESKCDLRGTGKSFYSNCFIRKFLDMFIHFFNVHCEMIRAIVLIIRTIFSMYLLLNYINVFSSHFVSLLRRRYNNCANA